MQTPPSVQAHFKNLLGSIDESDPVMPLVVSLAKGALTPADRHHLSSEPGDPRPGLRKLELDLVLSFIQEHLEAETFDATHQQAFTFLKQLFEVREGEFLEHRPVELATMLTAQLETILEDEIIDPQEDSIQAALQAALDLGYDQYLALTRRAFENVDSSLRAALEQSRDGPTAVTLRDKLSRLEPLIRLAQLQHRSLGALY